MGAPITTSYFGRLVDLEILQSVSSTDDITRVYPAITRHTPKGNTSPKMVTGIEKAVQRYFSLLTTDLGSVKFDELRGGMLVTRALNGTIGYSTTLLNLFTIASSNALSMMAEDDNDPEFGDQPDDEKITGASLSSWDINYATATISLGIDISFASGDTYTFTLPVTAGI